MDIKIQWPGLYQHILQLKDITYYPGFTYNLILLQ